MDGIVALFNTVNGGTLLVVIRPNPYSPKEANDSFL